MSHPFPPQTLPPTGSPELQLPPGANLFSRRSERLRQLAASHSLGPWLTHQAAVGDAQQAALDALLAEPPAWIEATQPFVLPVTDATLDRVAAVYATLVAALAGAEAPEPESELSAQALRSRVERSLLLAQAQTPAVGRDVTDLLVAAAMQVVWTAAARHATPNVPHPGPGGACPVCASAAGGSIVLVGEGRAGLRYQQCCLCATRWNVVRARCTLCEEGMNVSLLTLEGENPAIAAETCEHCHGYAKVYLQDKDRDVDPVADDLATLALDVLVGEEGFGRAAPNLFLCEGEALPPAG